MKNIVPLFALLCLGTPALAQSSITDVPASKPVTPVKPEPANSSVAPTVVKPIQNKPANDLNGGSTVQTAPAKLVTASPEVSGSVAPITQKTVTPKVVTESPVNSTNTGLKLAPSTQPEKLVIGSLGEVTPVAPVPVEATGSRTVSTNANTNYESVITRIGATPSQAGVVVTAPVAAENIPVGKVPEAKLDNTRPVQMAEVPTSVPNPTVAKPVANMQGNEKKKAKE